MKLTAKLAKIGFDTRYFLETLDYKDKGKLRFSKLLRELRDRFGFILSKPEEIALTRYLIP